MCDPDLDEPMTNPVIIQGTTPVDTDTPMETDVPDVCYEVIDHRWKNGWKFLTWWKGFPPSQATWEAPTTFILPTGLVTEKFRDYLKKTGLDALLRKALGSEFAYGPTNR
mgnify:CR=1 FL=1